MPTQIIDSRGELTIISMLIGNSIKPTPNDVLLYL